jgi:urease accessory protein
VTALRIRRLRLHALWFLTLAAALGGSPAEAHLITTGLGPVYDGISHFLLSPEDLVPAIVLALLAGQCGPDTARPVLFLLPTAWLVGGLVGFAAATTPPPDLTWLTFTALGGSVAAHVRLPRAAVMALACLVGLFEGFINGSAMSSGGAGMVSLIGIVATVFVVAALAAAATIAFTWPPAKVAVRVLGSWTTATGLLVLGWSLR